MASIYDDYDDMSGLQEFHDALQQAGASHEMASTHGDYDDMPGLEQTPLAQMLRVMKARLRLLSFLHGPRAPRLLYLPAYIPAQCWISRMVYLYH
jgi:hypothetical protein